MTCNAYETLYNTMRNNFTVVNNNHEYTLGEYMSMKANARSNEANLPVAAGESSSGSISAIVTYVSEKLAVTKPPVRDKVIRKFPFRTSAAAFLSAMVACALMFSYGLFALNSSTTVPTADNEQTSECEIIEETNEDFES